MLAVLFNCLSVTHTHGIHRHASSSSPWENTHEDGKNQNRHILAGSNASMTSQTFGILINDDVEANSFSRVVRLLRSHNALAEDATDMSPFHEATLMSFKKKMSGSHTWWHRDGRTEWKANKRSTMVVVSCASHTSFGASFLYHANLHCIAIPQDLLDTTVLETKFKIDIVKSLGNADAEELEECRSIVESARSCSRLTKCGHFSSAPTVAAEPFRSNNEDVQTKREACTGVRPMGEHTRPSTSYCGR